MGILAEECDIAVVGGGIVGLATAMALTARAPRIRLILLEKEGELAFHQTGHNSGVIHWGVYYRPGSIKAALCVQGARALLNFCQRHGIPIQQRGKVIVAVSSEELPHLQALHLQAQANQVPDCALIGPERLRELEPHAQGIQALYIPGSAVVDYSRVARLFAEQILRQGGEIRTGTQVTRMEPQGNRLLLHTPQGEFLARYLINCGGLHADRLAGMARTAIPLQIIPFRGEYYELIPSRRHLVSGLIYPVPKPQLPFLGVHLTHRIDGRVEAGPNAVLALKREGYRKTDVSLGDCLTMLVFPGFWRMSARYWRSAVMEMARSVSPKLFLRSVQRLVPEIQEEDLTPARSGVRAQALDLTGELLDDFHLVQRDNLLHVLNAPSPAATASIAIGQTIAQTAIQQFGMLS